MKIRVVLLSALTLMSCGCAGMSNTDRGLLTGGALGAGTGAIIGSAVGDPGAGALIGGGLGAVAGGLTGNAVDRAEVRAEDRAYHRIKAEQAVEAAQKPPLTLPDIVQMTYNHISDDIIIQQIRTTNSLYYLTPNDITYLKQNGVSDRVVLEMQNRQRPVYQAGPTVQREVTVIHQAYPPPPPSFAIGVGIGRPCGPRPRCGHW